jgi:SdpC family antimicrobial peptide
MWSPEVRAQSASAPREIQIAKLEAAIDDLKAGGWSPAVVEKAQGALETLRSGGEVPGADAEMQALQEEFLVERIAEQDPTFFDRFAADMQSGDLVRVDAAFGEATARLKTFVNGGEGKQPAVSVVPPNYYTPQHSSSTSGTSVYGPLAVAVAIAWVVVLFWVIGVVSPQESDRLGHDQMIVRLTAELQQG